ncbi:hypothetical protein, partial [Allofournierella massiliensis]|uniref:hypothetical protein n=1 Tax=Allofournierella massiliensis TaxID=1650663 RepID=UPI0024B0C1AC
FQTTTKNEIGNPFGEVYLVFFILGYFATAPFLFGKKFPKYLPVRCRPWYNGPKHTVFFAPFPNTGRHIAHATARRVFHGHIQQSAEQSQHSHRRPAGRHAGAGI